MRIKKYFLLSFLFILFYFFGVNKMLSAQEKIIDYVLADVNGKAVLLSDFHFEEKFLSESPVEIFVSDSDPLISLVDEIILCQQGLDSFKKEVVQKIKEVDNFLGNGNFSGAISGVVKKIRNSDELSREEKVRFERIFKTWQNDLICDFFFPGEKYIWREKDTRKILFSLADKLDVTPAFLKEKLLNKVFVKKAFDDFFKQKEKICIMPREIKKYYDQFPDEFLRIQHVLVGTQETSQWIVDKLNKGEAFNGLGIVNIQSIDSGVSSLSPLLKTCINGIIFKNNNGFGSVKSDLGWHIMRVEKISFQEVQENIREKILKNKEEYERELFFREFRKKAVVGVRQNFYSESLKKAGYDSVYKLGGQR